MHSLVLDELRVAREALPALGTLVGLLPGVSDLVADQLGAHAEALPALGALIGPLPGVDPLVLDEVRSLPKALPAVRAGEGFLSSVDSPMLDKVGAHPEALPTVPTYRQSPHSGVSLLDDVWQPPETFSMQRHSTLTPPQGRSLNPFWPVGGNWVMCNTPGTLLLG